MSNFTDFINEKKQFKNILTDIICNIFSILFIISFFILFFGLNKTNLYLPWGAYGGDRFATYNVVQNIKDSGWIYSNPRLAAPFTADFIDFLVIHTDNLANLLLKIIFYFSNNIFFSVNILFIINCIFISTISYFVLIYLKINRLIALLASLTYTLLPYIIIRNIGHLFLSMYLFIPLGLLLCFWIYTDDNFFNIKKNFFKIKQNVIGIIFCFLIANNGNGYYPFFVCFFVLLTGIIKTEFKYIKKIYPAIILVFLLSFLFFINLTPSIINNIINGKNIEVAVRQYIETELYGLKISQLLIPMRSHGLNFLIDIIYKNENSLLVTENRMSYLGIYGSIGCLILLVYIFIKKERNNDNNLLFLLSRLNIGAILLATIGGFSSLLAIIFSIQLRAYNRISIFIAYISILAVSIILNSFLNKIPNKKKIYFNILFFVFSILGILFQYPFSLSEKYLSEKEHVSFVNDSAFIQHIETLVPDGSMIYQLPFHRYPEEPPKNEMRDYTPFIGGFFSKNLRWSYGAIKGRYPDYWHQKVNLLPIDIKIQILSLVGFEGILIDKRAYTLDDIIILEQSISDILNYNCIYSLDKNLIYFSLAEYNKNNNLLYTIENLKLIKDNILNDIDEYISYNY